MVGTARSLLPPGHSQRTAVVIAACLAAMVTIVWRVLTFTGFNNDHYIYLAGAQQMLLGEWPVRDFVDPGWPLMYSVSALARLLFGRGLFVELLVVAASLAIGAAFTVAAASRLSGSVAIALAVTLLEVLINPRSFGYPKILLYAVAGWAFVAATSRLTSWRVALLGVLIVVAFLFRHDHGLYIGAGALTAVACASWGEGARAVRARVAVLAGAILVLLLPWALFVQYEVGLVEYIRPGLEFSRAEADATVLRALPRLDLTGPILTQGNLEVWLFYLLYAMPVACLALAWSRARHGRERWPGESAAVAAVSVMAIVMNLGFLRSPLAARLPDAMVPGALLGSWLIGLAWRTQGRTIRGVALAVATAVFVMSASAVLVIADVSGELNRAGVLGRRGAMRERIADLMARLPKPMPERSHIPSRNSEALMPFYAYLARCSSPSDRLVMTGLSPDVFVLANRGFAGGQMAFRPGFYATPDEQRTALSRMKSQSVPFVVVALEEEAAFRSQLPLVAAHVDQHYEPLAFVPVPQTRGLQLYVERGRPPASLDAATGWPCFPVTGRARESQDARRESSQASLTFQRRSASIARSGNAGPHREG
jgi:hypothetical protein